MKRFTIFAFSTAFTALFCFSTYQAQVALTYTFTGSPQSFTVPPCVNSLSLTAKGARGGSNAQGVLGGLGGTAFGVLSVTPGDVLYIYVGGSNGYNGGGLAGVSPCTAAIGGAGGGGSDVRLNGNSLANRVIVGGGGGGAGGDRILSCGRGTGGGGGGGYYGGGGGAAFPGNGGYTLPTGGSQIAGGIGGTSTLCLCNNNGLSGSLGTGGAGGAEVLSNQGISLSSFTGGAGGGLIGGPGQYSVWNGENYANGCGSSGGGGSSYFGSLSNAFTIPGNNPGNGEVIISYTTSIGALPVNFSQNYICLGGSATLNAASQVSYTWSTGSNASNIVVSPTVTSTYSVMSTNSLGCVSLGLITVTVNGNLPDVGITSSGNSLCEGNPVTLSGSGAYSYTWSGGVTNGSPFTPSTTSSYTVIGANGCGTASAMVTVSVNPNPSLTVNPASHSVCAGTATSLTATGANSYTWSGGIVNGAAFVPSVTTLYTVTGANAFGCMGTSTAIVNVMPSPSLSPVPSPSLLCLGESGTLSATGAGNYTWMPGGSNASSISVSPTITTVYSLTQSIGNCVDIKTVSLVVAPLPTVTALVSQTAICSGMAVTFSATGANTYTWTNNVQSAVPYFPLQSASYTVTGLSQNGCAGSAVISVSVTATPSLPPVASHTSICAGSSVTLSASGASAYTWMPFNANSATLSVSPNVTTTYTLVRQNGACFDTRTLSIAVIQTPFLQIYGPSGICLGQSATLAAPGAVSYTWQPYGGSGATAVLSPSVGTIFTLSASNGSCVSSISHSLTVNPNPSLSVSASPNLVCAGDPATLTATGATAYTWLPTPSTGSVIIVNPLSSTAYSVTGTNVFGCSSMVSQLLIVNPIPVLSLSASHTLICMGGSSTLSASGANTYSWTGGGTGSITVVSPASNTTFSVNGSLSSTGCSSTQTISVAVFHPQFTISGNPAVCMGGSTTLSASGANSYTWNGSLPSPSISVSPTVYTVYQVSATSASANVTCSSSQSIGVAVSPNPTISASASRTFICEGEPVVLSASGALSYTWSTFPPGASVTVVPAGQQHYTVTGTDANGCSDTAVVFVKISACVSMEELVDKSAGLLVYPNPSQGEFEISYPSDIDLILVNALGQLIRHIQLNNLNNHKEQVMIEAPGVYYLVNCTYEPILSQKILVGH